MTKTRTQPILILALALVVAVPALVIAGATTTSDEITPHAESTSFPWKEDVDAIDSMIWNDRCLSSGGAPWNDAVEHPPQPVRDRANPDLEPRDRTLG